MARPARPLWVTRAYARRRHRTWMRSMILATLGWGCWWIYLLLARFAPSIAPDVHLTGILGSSFGLVGLMLAILTLRARRTWILFVQAPLWANASLLLCPWVLPELLS